METTSRKLKRLIEEEEKTLARIEELQECLKEIREARKKEEDLVIIKSIRSMKLGARDLFDLLTAIREGNLSEELREQLLAEPEEDSELPEDAVQTGASKKGGPGRKEENAGNVMPEEYEPDPDYDEGAEDAPEREENDDDRQHD